MEKERYVQKQAYEKREFISHNFHWDTAQYEKPPTGLCILCKDHDSLFDNERNATPCPRHELGRLPNGNNHNYLTKYMRTFGYGSNNRAEPLLCHKCGDFAICQEERYCFCLKCWRDRYSLTCGTCGANLLNRNERCSRKSLVDQYVINPDCENCKIRRIYIALKRAGRERYLPPGYEEIIKEDVEVRNEEKQEDVSDIEMFRYTDSDSDADIEIDEEDLVIEVVSL